MRTTLTIDDDLADRVERLRVEEGITWKEAINRLLRLGLAATTPEPRERAPYRVRPVSTGRPRVDLTRVGELLVMEDEAGWE